MNRREFIRLAALLGISASAAYAMAGAEAPAFASDDTPFPPVDPNARAGGTLRLGDAVAKLDDPATFAQNQMVNQARPILESMCSLANDNVVRPMLITSWEPSTDLKVWTLQVRKNVMWHNGEELTADHIAWNIRRWADSSTGSPNLGLSTFNALSEATGASDQKGNPIKKPTKNGIEVLDAHTLRLNLTTPVLSVPEDCAEKTTLIVHPSFKPPFSDDPIGTGPYTLGELRVGERCVLKRLKTTTDGKDFSYWGGEVYLDEIHFYHFEAENQPAALASGSIDVAAELTIDQLELAKSIEGASILSTNTANTLCCRMQIDQKPFDDIRVRQAIVKSVDNAAIKTLVFPDGGSVGANFHVSPVHPEYFPLPDMVRDVEGAKKLLAEAGHEQGLDITITVGNTDGPWHQAACEAIRDQMKDSGINLSINVLPATKFWEVWDKAPFGATPWDHRPLGTMVLAQGYRSNVPWNETHFSNKEFDDLLDEAGATIDVEKRRAKMEQVEKILQDACIMVQAFWRPIYGAALDTVHGYAVNPGRQMQLTKVWVGS
ncbi:ABC transporter substrate-binding protein [Ensifer adhaerens]|uniref:ABC transporter substrate-binding protein n=1 Tax=Ensifer adhaerens TaxID=106592 RepID=UPI001CBE6ECD|nr:ABC transporter substrate-binding protein [Ensifer adhaerens]MBZ7924954.1 ABC transporter substrate-binding protein [Ensifer adhaerens]UAX95836.1 ABC transporter substrate-binding protein [Ensifer adhaerens]UAY04822.1 ABC transporter substrate-binding protein [Ensifer adhaerens]UAY10254.1 ABC transporter substrate-binding protein [Ensifer adhaerens]